MHWQMSVPHCDAAFGLPVIQVSVMPCHDDFSFGVDEGKLTCEHFPEGVGAGPSHLRTVLVAIRAVFKWFT
jgi:hypothetical protein